MNRKRARFDVVSIEITVHCPHCDSLRPSPSQAVERFTWDAGDIRHFFASDMVCARCFGTFRLQNALRNLLMPSTEPVRTDRRVHRVVQVEVICPNCSGDEHEPKKTLLSTDGRCASCGSDNVALVNSIQPDENNSNGKETR